MVTKKDLQEKLDHLREMYEKLIPFDRLLGIEIDTLTPTDVKVRIDMREELIGNFIRGMLHGGVISSVLDLTGGLIASVELVKHLENVEPDEVARRVARVGTIDLRVDYLRAGKGIYFTASGTVLRKGNKVAVIRTELCNDQNLLIAAGTGTYLVG
ncbi:MAG: thioesterase family protein [Deltaproteobacteria bacterium]|nr:thioesterase family protein [Deltaproteobacteria bacterium]